MDNFIKEGEQMMQGGAAQGQQVSQQGGQQAGQAAAQGGNSFMGGLEQAGEDSAINTGINSLLTKEGVPVAADGTVDAFVDKEANEFLGGNKNF